MFSFDFKKEDKTENQRFAEKYRLKITDCINDRKMCKLLGIKNIYDEKHPYVFKKLSEEDYLYCMARLYTLYLVVDQAKKTYTRKFDTIYRDAIDLYMNSDKKDPAQKKFIQDFFSVRELREHFYQAYLTQPLLTDVKLTSYKEDFGKREMTDIIGLLNAQLTAMLSVMMLTNVFSGFDYVS